MCKEGRTKAAWPGNRRRVGSERMGARLTVETSAARLVGRLSRAAGRGGGTTLPGKLLWKVDRGAVDTLAARLPAGVAVISATNGKTTTSAMLARILGSRYRLAWNHSGANLASGIASTLLAARDADLGLLEVDEFALPELMRRVRPRAVSLGNLFRDQLDRYGELEHIAERWRAAIAALPHLDADRQRRDPLVAELADGREQSLRFGVDDPRLARPALQHAADSKYCVRCGAPYHYAAAYVGHLGDYRCPACGHARPPLDIAARSIDLQALDASVFDLVTPAGSARVRLPSPVCTTSTTRSPLRRPPSCSMRRSTRSWRGSARSRLRSAGSNGSRPATRGS